MSELNPQPLPPRRIRVAVPGEIMNDLERFQKVQASVLGRVGGCSHCTSGLQIDWHEYEQWVVDVEGAVHPIAPAAVLGVREV